MKGVEVSAGQAAGGNLEEREKNVKRKRMSRPRGTKSLKGMRSRAKEASRGWQRGKGEGGLVGQLK